MERLKKFIKTTLLGGIGVILPVIIIAYVFYWVFSFLTGAVRPLAEQIFKRTAIQGLAADMLTILIIVGACFAVGLLVKSTLGKVIHKIIEDEFLKKIPGYGVVTDTVKYFTSAKKTPFSQVALIKPFGNDTMMTGFITDHHKGSYTVFIPTGPNPTSGNIMHLKKELVIKVDTPVEDAMQSILGGGAGSNKLVKAIKKKKR
jgi:uncharacterized membrane protein